MYICDTHTHTHIYISGFPGGSNGKYVYIFCRNVADKKGVV